MTHTGNARAEILAHIQRANQKALSERIGLHGQSPDMAGQSLRRDYTRAGSRSPEEVLALFEQRLNDYGANSFRAGVAELQHMIERILIDRGITKILVPAGLPAAWFAKTIQFYVDDGISGAGLGRYEGVLTGATVAIAATGTIVLQNVAGQGRRALSLVPDYHLCIIEGWRVVETVPEAFARLSATSSLPTTFISGPSATADIEMTRIQGVHGPRVLDVVLLT